MKKKPAVRMLRLKASDDFQRCYKQGKVWRSPLVVLHLYDRKDRDPARIGFSVSRRVGGAVQRNLVKRWMREVVRPVFISLPPGVDIVFSARRAALSAGFWQLREGIFHLMRRSGLIPKDANKQR